MKIVREDRENQTALLRITVEQADYAAEVEKKLHEYKRKANMPGFRPGMVPMNLIKRMYGKSVMAETTYKMANDGCFDYLQKENIDYVGDVLPAEEQGDFDFDNNVDHEFVFEIGIAPAIDMEIDKKDKLTKYTIEPSADMIDSFRQNFMRRYGHLVDVDTVTSDEAVMCHLDNGTISVEDAYVGLISMEEKDRQQFIGKKVGDVMAVNVNELYKNEKQRASVLGVKESELAELNPEFALKIKQIRQFANPELNEEFYKTAFPEGNVTNQEELEQYFNSEVAKQLQGESDYIFASDAKKYLLEKASFTMPEQFLKRWLLVINEGKYTQEDIERDFPTVLEVLRWNTLSSYLFKKYDLKFEQEDVLAEAKKSVAIQFAQYGMANAGDELLTSYAKQMMENREQVNKIVEKVSEEKILVKVEELANVESKSVTIDELGKIMAARQTA